jgi:hypothetical protein
MTASRIESDGLLSGASTESEAELGGRAGLEVARLRILELSEGSVVTWSGSLIVDSSKLSKQADILMDPWSCGCRR